MSAAANSTTLTTSTTAVPKLSSTSQPPLLIKKLSPDASTPTRGSAFAAGQGARLDRSVDRHARGTYGRVAPRSGLAAKHFIDTGAGVIDADYRGEVKVLLFNHGEADFQVNKGDRIAQLVLERIYTPEIVEVENLEESVRGAGGFGSTG
ncbi:hypothetical protein CLAIMM_14286 [Cladophialophora immunda]|nr:hypothetical protein CLAIMM_14286 [Cladophialophora immunda]